MSIGTDDLIGSLVLGRYRVVRPLAKGGMGMVYLARVEGAAGFSKPVVIKRVLPHLSDAKSSKAQFIREARILSNLQHPGIVGVIDFAEEQGALLMVLDYVHGYHVGQWLKYVGMTRGQLPWESAVLIMLRVLAALHYAHTFTRSDGSRTEIVHRDVSPGNILLDLEGNVRLLDFGIALMAEDKGGYQTQDGTFKGKLPYVAPEIYGSAKATPRSDIFAAAVVLYQLLSGDNPFAAMEMSDTVRRVLVLDPPPISSIRSDVPPELDGVLSRAMAKDPAARYASAEAFAADLSALLTRREDVVFAELNAMIRADFTGGMAKALKLHTLELLEAAWRDAQTGPEDTYTPLRSSTPPARHQRLVVDAPTVASADRGDRERPTVPVPRSGISKRQLLLAVVGTALLAGGVATAAVLLTRDRAAPQSQRFLVVEAGDREGQRPSGGPERITPAEPAPAPAPGGSSSAAPVETATQVPNGRQASAPASGTTHEAARLSSVFSRKQGAIQGCFQAHTENLEGSPRVAIRFDVDASGQVTAATVQPSVLAGTALGQCLQRVARSTNFGPQPGPRAFTIPIHARAH